MAGAPIGGPLDPDFVARDLREAAIWILRREGRPLPDRPGAPLLPPIVAAAAPGR